MPRFALLVGLLAAGAAGAAAKTPPKDEPSLTLYERADFAGRQAVFHGVAETARQAFTAHSAKSTGVWTLCEGRDPASKCQTVNGPAPKLKIEPAIVRPGVDAVALYEKPGLQGRRVVYSFGSDIPPPFKAKSARTWGGAWSLCDTSGGKCQVIEGEHPVVVNMQVGLVKPGREPQRLQLALAESPAALPPDTEPPAAERPLADPNPIDHLADDAVKTPFAPRAAAPPVEVATASPPPPEAAPPPREEPPPALAEAPKAPAEERPSPYVDVPIPPRAAPSLRDAGADPDRSDELPRAVPPPNQVRRVAYSCVDGEALTVVFDDGGGRAVVQIEGERPQALRQTDGATGGGFFYEGSGHVLFGAGVRAGYASDGAEPVECYVRGRGPQFSASRDEEPFAPGRQRRRQYDYGSPPADQDGR